MKLILFLITINTTQAGQWMKVKKDLTFTGPEGSRATKVLVKEQEVFDTSAEPLNSVADKVYIIDDQVCEGSDYFMGKKVILNQKWHKESKSYVLWIQRYPYTRIMSAGFIGQRQRLAEFHSPEQDVPNTVALPKEFDEKLQPELCLLMLKSHLEQRKYEMQSKYIQRKKKAISKAIKPYLEKIPYDYGSAE